MRVSTFVLAAFAGFVSGAIGCHMTLYAQAPGVDILRSRNFVLLDDAGRKRGSGRWILQASR